MHYGKGVDAETVRVGPGSLSLCYFVLILFVSFVVGRLPYPNGPISESASLWLHECRQKHSCMWLQHSTVCSCFLYEEKWLWYSGELDNLLTLLASLCRLTLQCTPCTHAHATQSRTHTRTHIQYSIVQYARTHTHAYARVAHNNILYTHTQTHTDTDTDTDTDTHTHTHTHTHTRTHAHTFTCTHRHRHSDTETRRHGHTDVLLHHVATREQTHRSAGTVQCNTAQANLKVSQKNEGVFAS